MAIKTPELDLRDNPFKNYVINSNFDFWQRNTSFSTPSSGAYTADRFQVNYDGTIGAFTLSRQAFALGQSEVPNEPTYFLRWNQTSAGSGSTGREILHHIESVRTLAGKRIAVSFWAKADTSRTLGLAMQQHFGTGGSPSSPVTSTQQDVSLTTSWQKFTLYYTLPSISGKTLGSNDNHRLSLRFRLPLNVTMTIDMAQIMVNEGVEAVQWQLASGGIKNQAGEFALCQRYYQIGSFAFKIGATSTVTQASGIGGFLMFQTTMRTTSPSVSRTDNTVETASNFASTATEYGINFNGTKDIGSRSRWEGTFTADAEF